ncbi:hypothetical protein [Paenibacillus vini]|uniref:Uncharacterized protein n=1 Tax=Paenibacillus vini TaxID=1476024 RepID=A0ABQ4MB75_9BACL|nr:hypothetical protein [Paenibacillus vini]GIP53239.1 hypothetical protein J42TS3_22740 [Paenibacillus vini]
MIPGYKENKLLPKELETTALAVVSFFVLRNEGVRRWKTKGIREAGFVEVESEGDAWLRVRVPYISEWIVQIRKVPGRKWDGSKKCWMISADEKIVIILCSV